MSLSDFYHHKAKQCEELPAATTNPRDRAKFQEEAALWHEIAKDMERQERSEEWPPPKVCHPAYQC